MTLQEFAVLTNAMLNYTNNVDMTSEAEDVSHALLANAFKQLSNSDRALVRSFCDARLAEVIF